MSLSDSERMQRLLDPGRAERERERLDEAEALIFTAMTFEEMSRAQRKAVELYEAIIDSVQLFHVTTQFEGRTMAGVLLPSRVRNQPARIWCVHSTATQDFLLWRWDLLTKGESFSWRALPPHSICLIQRRLEFLARALPARDDVVLWHTQSEIFQLKHNQCFSEPRDQFLARAAARREAKEEAARLAREAALDAQIEAENKAARIKKGGDRSCRT